MSPAHPFARFQHRSSVKNRPGSVASHGERLAPCRRAVRRELGLILRRVVDRLALLGDREVLGLDDRVERGRRISRARVPACTQRGRRTSPSALPKVSYADPADIDLEPGGLRAHRNPSPCRRDATSSARSGVGTVQVHNRVVLADGGARGEVLRRIVERADLDAVHRPGARQLLGAAGVPAASSPARATPRLGALEPRPGRSAG